VDLGRAREAIERDIARPLGLSVLAAAAGVVDVVNAGMAAALRIVSVERGHDPRESTLVAFGGAGPVHAARLAEELEIPRVVVPPIPGGFSALGLVASDVRRDYVRTFYARLDAADVDALARAWNEMEQAARAMLDGAGVPAPRQEVTRSADLRYGRQAYELTVPVAAGPLTRAALARVAAEFHDRHRQTYGHASPDEPVQLVNVRVAAVGKLAGLDLSRAARASAGPGNGAPARAAAGSAREAYFRETGLARVPVLARASLAADAEHGGPVIIESMDTTVVVPPGWRARVGDQGCIVLERVATPGSTRRAP
jgi:N-methylhydantoinase A